MGEDAAYDWYDKATIAFQKLSPKSGDIITITLPRATDPRQIEMVAALVQDAIQDHIPEGVTTMCVQGGIDWNVVTKETMAKHGWYKLGGN